jgi:broad specificity phosphatase PhoE
VRLFVLARHAHSTLNAAGRINGDPAVPVALTREGREDARELGLAIAHVPLDLCVHTRFERTAETARIALGPRRIETIEEPLLDDVDVGDLEGWTIEDYRSWKKQHRRSDPFPGGESLDDAARRYARAYRRLLERTERNVLVVCHEIPIRYAVNAAAVSDDLDGPEHAIPNATPFLFDAPSLERAAVRLELLAR